MIEPAGLARTILVLLSLLLSIVGYLEAVTVVDHYPQEEYIIEHRVTYQDAITEARSIKIYPGPIPGCKECTSSEMTYCKDNSVINDHCCCGGGYDEVFPFVEHTCRLSRQPCKVLAGDCAEYTRLKDCCCHTYLASLWKYKASGTSNKVTNLTAIIGVITVLDIIRRLLLL